MYCSNQTFAEIITKKLNHFGGSVSYQCYPDVIFKWPARQTEKPLQTETLTNLQQVADLLLYRMWKSEAERT